MASKESSRVQIWIALITLAGTLGGAIIYNWDKISRTEESKVSIQDTSIISKKPNEINSPNKSKNNSDSNSHSDKGSEQQTLQSSAEKASKEIGLKKISGQIQNSQGQPVIGAKIVCLDCIEQGQIAYSDQDGRFVLPHRIKRERQVHMIHLAVSSGSHRIEDNFEIGDEPVIIFDRNN